MLRLSKRAKSPLHNDDGPSTQTLF